MGIHLPNRPQSPISCYAVLSLGAIVVNLNPMYTMEGLRLMVKTTGMTTLITVTWCFQPSAPSAGKLAAYKVPKRVEFRDSLPKSAVGKILRKVLRAEEEAKQKEKKKESRTEMVTPKAPAATSNHRRQTAGGYFVRRWVAQANTFYPCFPQGDFR